MTFDGVRHREMFAGPDAALACARTRRNRALRGAPSFLNAPALAAHRAVRRNMPIGNGHNFSYPGYNSLLTGHDDARIASNAYGPDPNRTFMERAIEAGDMGAASALMAATWHAFDDIYAAKRSGIRSAPNAGSAGPARSRARFLRAVAPAYDASAESMACPHPEDRHDVDTCIAFLEEHARRARRGVRVRALHLALGLTDDFAHAGNYYQHLNHLHLGDRVVRHLYAHADVDPDFVVVTTDHGRGRGAEWTSHGSRVAGCDTVWCIVLCNNRLYKKLPPSVRRAMPRQQRDIAPFLRDLTRRARGCAA